MAWYHHIWPKQQTEHRVLNSDTFTVMSSDPVGMQSIFGSGESVTPNNALTISAVYSCVSKISGVLSTSPVKVYKKTENGAVENPVHNLTDVLRIRPNENYSASTFWMNLIIDKLLRGNGYAQIIRNRLNQIVGLNWLNADHVNVYYASELGVEGNWGLKPLDLMYVYTDPTGKRTWLETSEVLHIPNMNFDGKKGMSCIAAGALAINLAKSAEISADGLFKNGMQTKIAIAFPDGVNLKDGAADRLKNEIKKQYTGSSNHHKPLLLTHGAKAQQLSLSSEDAELLESRKFSVIDICRFFDVPPVLIGESEKTSSWGKGVEEVVSGFIKFTMNKHFVAFEQEIEFKLFKGGNHFASFDETFITRGDSKARAEYNKAAVGGTQNPGWMTVNEIRQREGLSPIPDGDQLVKMPEKVEANKNVDE